MTKDKTITFRLSQELYDSLTNYCEETQLTKANAICIGISELIAKRKVYKSLDVISAALDKYSQDGKISPEDVVKIDEFQKVCDIALGRK